MDGPQLRVLFIVYRDFMNPSAVGGDFYLWELAKGLSNLGNHVTIICSSFPDSKKREVIDGVEFVRLKGVWSLPFKILKMYIKRLKGNFDVVVEEAIGGQRFPFFCTVYVKEPLVAVWHQKHDKIFHEQYSYPVAAVLSFFEFFQARLYRKRTIINPSKGAREKLATLGFDRESIRVIYDGVGGLFDNAKMSEERENVIVWLGKIRRYKRPDHAIMALAEVIKKTNENYTLVIAGKVSEIDADYVDELRGLAENLDVSDNVEFRFNISEAEKLDLLERASVLVQPSPVEGFSIVVMEANRCGTPVVVSDGVPGDVVINGHNGLVYPYGDIEAFSDALTKLFVDKELWTKLSKNAFSWAQNFTWEKSALKFDHLLNDTLSLNEA
ncbi:MAG: glycosyltransferase family 4 protein [Candidatus Bathyarchaeota archaeon]|jgi:glycosyltransferase involved in cell wall biosynthesis